jgi:hypothetical protein
MYRVKLTYWPRYGWSGVLYIRGQFAFSGDFYASLEDIRDRITEQLRFNGLI